MRWSGAGVAAFATSTAFGRIDDAFTSPPGEESDGDRARIDAAIDALSRGRTADEVMLDSAFLPVRPFSRFRAALERHAPRGSLAMTPAAEPGVVLVATITAKDAAGRPVPGALVYAYHTSAKGLYAESAAHFRADSGDVRHARLFGYVRSDDAGRCVLRTIRPAGYPRTDLPAHVHVHIDPPPGRPAMRGVVTELQFDDDPRLTSEWRKQSAVAGFVITKPVRDESGVEFVSAEIVLR